MNTAGLSRLTSVDSRLERLPHPAHGDALLAGRPGAPIEEAPILATVSDHGRVAAPESTGELRDARGSDLHRPRLEHHAGERPSAVRPFRRHRAAADPVICEGGPESTRTLLQ